MNSIDSRMTGRLRPQLEKIEINDLAFPPPDDELNVIAIAEIEGL